MVSDHEKDCPHNYALCIASVRNDMPDRRSPEKKVQTQSGHAAY